LCHWIACVQDRGKCKEVVEKAKTFNYEVQRLEEEEERIVSKPIKCNIRIYGIFKTHGSHDFACIHCTPH